MTRRPFAAGLPDLPQRFSPRVSRDEGWMRQALALARLGLGRTLPNPAVGAILVREGRALGRGFHARAGLPHAEPNAIAQARALGHDPAGATLYVTLEPCSSWGRTPPCTELIIRSGIASVIVGATDPDPRHRGRAYALLRAAGIEVVSGVLEGECQALNPDFHARFIAIPQATGGGIGGQGGRKDLFEAIPLGGHECEP